MSRRFFTDKEDQDLMYMINVLRLNYEQVGERLDRTDNSIANRVSRLREMGFHISPSWARGEQEETECREITHTVPKFPLLTEDDAPHNPAAEQHVAQLVERKRRQINEEAMAIAMARATTGAPVISGAPKNRFHNLIESTRWVAVSCLIIAFVLLAGAEIK